MRLDLRCIEDRFRLGPVRLARRLKAVSQYGKTHNAGIFPLKNHSIAPVTHLGFHNPYTEIHKVAWAEPYNFGEGISRRFRANLSGYAL